MPEDINKNFLDYEWWKTATVEDVKSEIAKGADVNAKDNEENTALHIAVFRCQNFEAIKILTECGADVNTRNKYGHTPLWEACESKSLEIAEYLLKNGASANDKNENGEFLPDEQRLKWWGKVIRKTNIDELTQILHILIGQMSFIGPRPLLPKEMLVMTTKEQEKRQSIRPGIVGWESVNEDKSSSRAEMAQFDLYYVDHRSFGLDVKILFKTIFGIFRRPDDSLRAPKLSEEEIKKAQKRDKEEDN